MPVKKSAAKKAVKSAKSQPTTAKTPTSEARAGQKVTNAGEQAAAPSMPKGGRDPQGGLTAKGREYFNKKEGSHLRPGVQGPADTPEKMVRKGSFLRRHFANPRGPMKDDKGEPTRLALSAHAWGEPVPDTMADAKHLADEGHELLEQYHALKEGQSAAPPRKRAAQTSSSAKKTPGRRRSATKAVAKTREAKPVAAKKSAAKLSGAARNPRAVKTSSQSTAARKSAGRTKQT